MSDIEEVVIPRRKKDTKPEIAREKLKEKRERLKKEKEEKIIEEAKKKLAAEQEKQRLDAERKKKEEEEKRANDPMEQMMKKFEMLLAKFDEPANTRSTAIKNTPIHMQSEHSLVGSTEQAFERTPEQPKKQRKPRKPKQQEPDEVVYAEVQPPASAPKQRKKRVTLQETVESPSNNFVGDDEPRAQNIIEYPNQNTTHPLLSAMMARRNMNSWHQ